jgi:Zn-dependent protease with chaperone function
MKTRIAFLSAVFAATALAQLPVIRPAFSSLSAEQAKEIQGECVKGVLQNSGFRMVNDPALAGRVQGIFAKLATTSRVRGQRVDLMLLDDTMWNAFACPGGPIFLTSGIVRDMENDDQIAAVMGHELAHVVLRHSEGRISQLLAMQAGLELLANATRNRSAGAQIASLGAQFGAQILSLKFSRDNEHEADLLGVQLAAEAGYRPTEAATIWKRKAEEGPTSKVMTFLYGSHPEPVTRANRLSYWAPLVAREIQGKDLELTRTKCFGVLLPPGWKLAPSPDGCRAVAGPATGIYALSAVDTDYLVGIELAMGNEFSGGPLESFAASLAAKEQSRNAALKISEKPKRVAVNEQPAVKVELEGKTPSTGKKQRILLLAAEQAGKRYAVRITAPTDAFKELAPYLHSLLTTLEVTKPEAGR